MFSQERRRRLFVASKHKNSCFTWSIARPAMTPTFSPPDALFLNDKVHNISFSLCSCTRKIIGHPKWCKMARWSNQLTLKVEFTGHPPMLYPHKDHNLAIRTPFELVHRQIVTTKLGARPSPSLSASTIFQGMDPG